MSRRTADVVIVGAGPAGAVTALLLARAGFEVLLLDRATFPRPKPCGDCLSLGTRSVLERLGLLDATLAAAHAELHGWRIVAPDGAAFESSFNTSADGRASAAIAIERAVLDDLLVRAACSAGATLLRETVVDLIRSPRGAITGVQTRTGEVCARIVIGADGLRSIVAGRLRARVMPGPLRKLSLTMHIDHDAPSDFGEMHVGDGICAGLACVDANGRCNLTVVADSGRHGRAVARDAHAFVHAAVATFPALDRLRARLPDRPQLLASGPFDRSVRRITFDGAVLVGDAAGYYDPFTGQGVYQAIVSAERLAPVVENALDDRDTRATAFDDYVRQRSTLVRGARTVQRGIEFILSRPALANAAIRRIRRAPAFAQAILAVTGDSAPPAALLSPHCLASLLLPAPVMEDAA